MKWLCTAAEAQNASAAVCFPYMSYLKAVSPLAACILLAFFATPVMAQTAVEIEAAAAIDANVTPQPFMKPLDAIKARAQQIKDGTMRPKDGPRPDMDVKLKAGAEGGARLDIMKERNASSTRPGGLKALVMMHGGAIKNRFRLAIEHLNNLLERMDTRLGKMADAGVDTAAAAKLKVEAELAVDKAEADAKAVADFAATAEDTTDRASFKAELEAKMRTAGQSVKAAHQAVVKAVRALVQLAKDNKPKVDAEASVETSATVETDVQ
jgi:hypothetical protein